MEKVEQSNISQIIHNYTQKQDETNWYIIGAIVSGVVIAIGTWIYAIVQWGFLLGIMFGWIPALIAGVIGGLLWPLIVLAIVIIILLPYLFSK